MNSLSKGIFVFPNGAKDKPLKVKSSKFRIPQTLFDFEKNSYLWNKQFEKSWQLIQSNVEILQTASNESSFVDLIRFIEESNKISDSKFDVAGTRYLPVAALMTGINKPDHHQYFRVLSDNIKTRNKVHIATLPARDCPNIKSAVEVLVSSILSGGSRRIYDWDEENNNSFTKNTNGDDSSEEIEASNISDADDEPPIKLRKSQYTMDVLQSWYANRYAETGDDAKPKVIIIVPNFEEFKASVIQDLILILSNHINDLPIVLILGVATSMSSIFHTLSFTQTTRIKLREFASQSPVIRLNQIIEDIVLTPKSSFHLSNKLFAYLTDVFLFYDLTTTEFIKSFKLCMLEHYSQGNAYAICAPTYEQSVKNIKKLTIDDIESIRRLPSFRPYVESLTDWQAVVDILTNDEYFRKILITMAKDIYSYFFSFHCCLRVLLLMVKELPNAPLGKHLRDIYSKLEGYESIVDLPELQRCWQLLELMSKGEFISLLEKCCQLLEDLCATYCIQSADEYEQDCGIFIRETRSKIKSIIFDLSMDKPAPSTSLHDEPVALKTFESRHSMQTKLLELAKQSKSETNNDIKNALNVFKDQIIGRYLLPFKNGPPLIELFVYSDFNNIRTHLRGAPRSAVHTALRDPQQYLQCNCCVLNHTDRLLPTMPDISIAYKLLEESGHQVNLYDWLQAFRCVIEGMDVDTDEVSPMTQAKFTRARAELQFLGFIKNSKRKTDHVTRTTW